MFLLFKVTANGITTFFYFWPENTSHLFHPLCFCLTYEVIHIVYNLSLPMLPPPTIHSFIHHSLPLIIHQCYDRSSILITCLFLTLCYAVYLPSLLTDGLSFSYFASTALSLFFALHPKFSLKTPPLIVNLHIPSLNPICCYLFHHLSFFTS